MYQFVGKTGCYYITIIINHDLIAKYSAAPFLVLAFLALADGCLQLLILQVNFRVTPSTPFS